MSDNEARDARAKREQNRKSWNEATRAHNSHKGDQAAFLRDGGSTLFPEELELLGDLTGKSLVHLMCNAGQDTLSLARHGASVLGVDISDEAVATCRALSRDSGIAGNFERSDIYDWFASTDQQFDLAYSSYGVIGWLSDLRAWARGVYQVLKPGGRFVLIEFHPTMWLFEEIGDGPVIDRYRIRYPYSGGACVRENQGVGDYVAQAGEGLSPMGYDTGVENFENPHHAFAFCWGVEDIVGALLDAGLRLTQLRDYSYSNGCKLFASMKSLPDRRYTMPDGVPSIPLMLGVVAERPR